MVVTENQLPFVIDCDIDRNKDRTHVMDEKMIVEHGKGVTGDAQLAYLLLSIFIMCLLASVWLLISVPILES